MKVEATPDRPAIRQWLLESRIPPKVHENIERLARSEDVRHVVVLPDVHPGKWINNGCGAATVDLIYPQAVGSDIGCGLSALAFHGTADSIHLGQATPAASGLKYLDTRSAAGRAYLHDMDWAVQYATLHRLAILARVAEFLESAYGLPANEDSYMASPHNFARREPHHGMELIVHRKSANSAGRNEPSLIAGSTGSPSFLVHGLGNADSLCSSSHGAGRARSRTEARQRIKPADLKRQLGSVHHDARQLAALCDEAPAAYRDIRKVMQAQRELIRQQARLSPVLNFKYPDRRSG